MELGLSVPETVPTDGSIRTVACTTTTTATLRSAQVLARSYLRHHPSDRFVILTTDRLGSPPQSEGGCTLVSADWLDLDPDEYLQMAARFTAAELVAAVRPLMLRQVLARADVAVHLDLEVYVLGRLTEVTSLAAEHDVVLTPLLRAPCPSDAREPADELVSGRSLYPGFLAVGPGAVPFLVGWQDRLFRDSQCSEDDAWPRDFDRIPELTRHHISRSPGLGAAYWNLHERAIDDRVLFAVMRGYSVDTPWLLSQNCRTRPRHLLSERPDIAGLVTRYHDELVDVGVGDPAPAYGFARMSDGTRYTEGMRVAYRSAWDGYLADLDAGAVLDPESRPPDHPFGEGCGAFRAWLAAPGSPAEHAARLSRLMIAVWHIRPDLRAKYPHPYATGVNGFRRWCKSTEAAGVVPKWSHPTRPAKPSPPEKAFGVNVGGYLTAEVGLGEMGRIVHRAVQAAGIPLCSVIEERSLRPYCRTALAPPTTTNQPKHPISVLAVNGDQTEVLVANFPDLAHERYRIGVWAWELEKFPSWMQRGFAHVDEVWTLSEFCRDAIAPHSPVPVKVIPMPVGVPTAVRRRRRSPHDPISFLFCFDFNSSGERKNPWGAVTAFQRAFPDRADARLTIKATNGGLHPASVERLLRTIGGDSRITLLQEYLSLTELDELYAANDAYVSLHRSEGFGLTVAEAMARAMPVVATDYSSTTEFFNSDVGWPVPWSRIQVGVGNTPYEAGATWADPDLDAAASMMREIANDPSEAARRGDAARRHISQTRSMELAAVWVADQLREAYKLWVSGATRDSTPQAETPATAPSGPLGSTGPRAKPLARQSVRSISAFVRRR